MSTVQHAHLAIINLQERLTTELQFSVDSQSQIAAAFDHLRGSLAYLESTISTALTERQRAIATALGNQGPQPETVEHTTIQQDEVPPPPPPLKRKPKLVNGSMAIEGEE